MPMTSPFEFIAIFGAIVAALVVLLAIAHLLAFAITTVVDWAMDVEVWPWK